MSVSLSLTNNYDSSVQSRVPVQIQDHEFVDIILTSYLHSIFEMHVSFLLKTKLNVKTVNAESLTPTFSIISWERIWWMCLKNLTAFKHTVLPHSKAYYTCSIKKGRRIHGVTHARARVMLCRSFWHHVTGSWPAGTHFASSSGGLWKSWKQWGMGRKMSLPSNDFLVESYFSP